MTVTEYEMTLHSRQQGRTWSDWKQAVAEWGTAASFDVPDPVGGIERCGVPPTDAQIAADIEAMAEELSLDEPMYGAKRPTKLGYDPANITTEVDP